MKNGFVRSMVMIYVILMQSVLHAQIDSLKHYYLEGLVVTATRTEVQSGDIGRSVSVITEKEIRNSSCRTVGELLSLREGLYMIGTKQTPGAIHNVFMRGANSNHTLVMIDGMRLSDPSSVDNALDLSELSLTDIERIEIVRGSHSTLYGSSAIGGAINIITKKNSLPGLNGTMTVQTGTFGSGTSELSENASVNYTFSGGWYANAEFFHTSANGMNASIDTSRSTAGNKPDNDGFRKLDLVGKAGYRSGKWDIYGAYKTVRQNSDLDQAAYMDDPNYTINFQRRQWSYGAAYRFNDQWSAHFLGGYASTDRKAVNDSNILDGLSNHTYFEGRYGGTLANQEIQIDLNSLGIDWVVGAGRYKETMTTGTLLLYTDPVFPYSSASDLDTLDIHSVIYNAYIHSALPGKIVHEGLNKWALSLGGRINHHSSYGSNFTYDINPSYEVRPGSLIFASYATGFNAPSLYRLFTPETYYASDIQRGNKSLKPETSVSYELGFKRTGQNLRISASIFYTKVKNYIDFVYLWDENIPIDLLGTDFMRDDYRGDTYLNIGDQINKGIEASVGVRMGSKLTMFGNATLVRGKLRYDPEKIDADQTQGHRVQVYANGAFLDQKNKTSKLVRRPSTGNAGLTYAIKQNLSMTAVVQYSGSRRDVFYDQTLGPYGALNDTPLRSFWTADVSANYEFDKRWLLAVKIENLLNERTSEIRGFRNRGRGLLLNVSYKL